MTNSNSAKLGKLHGIVCEMGSFLINCVYMGELRLIWAFQPYLIFLGNRFDHMLISIFPSIVFG